MPLRVTVTSHSDPEGEAVVAAAPLVGVDGLAECRVARIFHLDTPAPLDRGDVDRICREVLVDPVVAEYTVGEAEAAVGRAVEVAALPGVTDVEARELERAAQQLQIADLRVSTAVRYDLIGDLDDADVAVITKRLLANETIEQSQEGTLDPTFSARADPHCEVESVPLADLSDSELATLSSQRLLSLDVEEMRAIKRYFGDLGRSPTDAELETLAQTWSEHCVHKTFRAAIELTHIAADGATTVTRHDGLLAALREVTEELDPWWLRSAFVDDAGIVAFDDRFDLAFKVETHNHPSALEPFGGANTGVGGVVRDVLGVSARPIACTNVLCFGPVDEPDERLAEGVLHPRRIRDGVVEGIADYGNKLGLPTVNGAVVYDEGYIGNPLVYCGALGLLVHGSHPSEARLGDRVVSIGGRVGRDGIHGATFSSATMDASTVDSVGAAVQIGDPITEKGCIEVVERACAKGLYNAITDCGAGGFSSAVGEMGEDLGVEIDLEGVPLKYPGLQPWEIWLSEAQERMVLAVPPESLPELQQLCDDWDVELTDLGSFSGTGDLVVRHGDTAVIDMSMDFLHNGLPRREMTAVWADPPSAAVESPPVDESMLLDLLAHPDVASKEDIVRRYDHEVRAGTVVRPLVGRCADGPADAAVLKPLGTQHHPSGGGPQQRAVPACRQARPVRHGTPGPRRSRAQPGSGRRRPRPGGAARQFLLGRPHQERPTGQPGACRAGLHRRSPPLLDAVHLRQGQPLQRVRGTTSATHTAHLRVGAGAGPEPRHRLGGDERWVTISGWSGGGADRSAALWQTPSTVSAPPTFPNLPKTPCRVTEPFTAPSPAACCPPRTTAATGG